MSTSCTNRSIIVNLRLDLLVSLLGLRIIILDLALLGGCGGLLGAAFPLVFFGVFGSSASGVSLDALPCTVMLYLPGRRE
jgi:hypothetical protein